MTDRKNLSLKERISLYEKVENSLREFFDLTNFCNENCFSKKEAVIGWRRFEGNIMGPGNEGCCHNKHEDFYKFHVGLDNFYPKTLEYEEEFEKMQAENIKEEFEKTGTCEYHTDSGCAIEKFRSPICNSWVCEKYGAHLFNKFNIIYSGNSYYDKSVDSLLSIVFKEEINMGIINKTLDKLTTAKKRIQNYKEGKEYKRIIRI